MLPGAVKVEVATFHTSDTRLPNVVNDLVALDQTFSGIVAAKEVLAVRTVASV